MYSCMTELERKWKVSLALHMGGVVTASAWSSGGMALAMLRRERAFARVHRVDMGTNDTRVWYTVYAKHCASFRTRRPSSHSSVRLGHVTWESTTSLPFQLGDEILTCIINIREFVQMRRLGPIVLGGWPCTSK